MPQKGNLAIFEGSNISKTGETMPTKIGAHALDINSYLHKFFEPIPMNSIFWWPWTIVHAPKGKFGRFWQVAISPKPETTPTKTDVHARDIDPYLHEFFEPIPID